MANSETGKKTINFEIMGGFLHPDPRHLGSRLFGRATISTYNLHNLCLVVKEKNIEYVISYVEDYLTGRKVDIGKIEVI